MQSPQCLWINLIMTDCMMLMTLFESQSHKLVSQPTCWFKLIQRFDFLDLWMKMTAAQANQSSAFSLFHSEDIPIGLCGFHTPKTLHWVIKLFFDWPFLNNCHMRREPCMQNSPCWQKGEQNQGMLIAACRSQQNVSNHSCLVVAQLQKDGPFIGILHARRGSPGLKKWATPGSKYQRMTHHWIWLFT